MNEAILTNSMPDAGEVREEPTNQLRFRRQHDGRIMLEQAWIVRGHDKVWHEWRTVPMASDDSSVVEE